MDIVYRVTKNNFFSRFLVFASVIHNCRLSGNNFINKNVLFSAFAFDRIFPLKCFIKFSDHFKFSNSLDNVIREIYTSRTGSKIRLDEKKGR